MKASNKLTLFGKILYYTGFLKYSSKTNHDGRIRLLHPFSIPAMIIIYLSIFVVLGLKGLHEAFTSDDKLWCLF